MKARDIAIGVLVLVLLAALGLGAAWYGGAFRSRHASPGPEQTTGTDPWAQSAADGALVTDPTSELTPDQIAYLRRIAAGTWSYLSGPGMDAATHLPLDSVAITGGSGEAVSLAAPTSETEYTNPALIGTYLSAIAAARDLGLASADEAESDAAAVLGDIERLPKYEGFLYRWYSTRTAQPLDTPRGEAEPAGYVSTVDNGWLAQGLVVAAQAFPQLSGRALSLLGAMQWGLLYDSAGNVLYNGYQVGKGYSHATYDNEYSGPRIADYMAIASGKVPGSLWWGLNRTPAADKGQQQTPQGTETTYTDPQNHRAYTVFEGYYVYDRIKFVPTFNGSLYQALSPDLIVPEQTMAPQSLGLNDRNTALAQGAFAQASGDTVWGWAPATSPGPRARYTNYGVPDLGSTRSHVSDAVVTPYAACLALLVAPRQAYADLTNLVSAYPELSTRYGFLDSVDIRTGQTAQRYMAVSQLTILMAIDDAVDHDRLQTYFAGSAYAQTLAPYLAEERYAIQGLADVSGTSAATPAPTRTRRHKRS